MLTSRSRWGERMKPRIYNFAIVFKSSNQKMLELVEDFIARNGGRIIYRNGPTRSPLFVIRGGGNAREEGLKNARED